MFLQRLLVKEIGYKIYLSAFFGRKLVKGTIKKPNMAGTFKAQFQFLWHIVLKHGAELSLKIVDLALLLNVWEVSGNV